jgi:hypothetical protein
MSRIASYLHSRSDGKMSLSRSSAPLRLLNRASSRVVSSTVERLTYRIDRAGKSFLSPSR